MGDNNIIRWLWAVMVFMPASKRLWEMSANYDTIAEFTDAVNNSEIDGLTDKERERASKILFDDAERLYECCVKLGMNVYCYESEGYPETLKRIANPPAVLFAYGNLDFLNDKCIISIVGSRNPSEYSVKTTERICRDLIDRNCLLASGFAGGIDQLVNRVSIDCNSMPVAVCGTALDSDYPKDSGDIKKQIAESGVIFSEYYPGFRSFGNAFVNRNRILTGISSGVLFAECSRSSHGLDNVNHAVSQGKQIFVIPPHDIYDERYFGQRDLIRDECQPVFGAEDIVYSLGSDRFESLKLVNSMGEFTLPAEDSVILGGESVKPRKTRKKSKSAADKVPEEDTQAKNNIDYSQLDESGQKICRLLKNGRMLADDIAARSQMDIADVLALLTELELDGIVRSFPGKMFGL